MDARSSFWAARLQGVSVKKFCNLAKLSNITHCFFSVVRRARTMYKDIGLKDNPGLNAEEMWIHQKLFSNFP